MDTGVGVEGFRRPWLTIGLIVMLIVVFVAEARLAIGPISQDLTLNVLTLKALGGIDYQSVVRDEQWYRLLTGPLLHASLAHLLGNTIALLIAGAVLEKLLGRAWYVALFLLGAAGGGVGSLMLNRVGLVSVGASGAVMAMFAALLVTSFRLPRGGGRSRLQWRSIRILVPSLLPVTTTVGGLTIDYGAHIGGAVTGAAIGFFLLRTWPDTSRLPVFQPVAAAVAVIAIPLLVGAWGDVASRYPHRYGPGAAIQAPRHDERVIAVHP